MSSSPDSDSTSPRTRATAALAAAAKTASAGIEALDAPANVDTTTPELAVLRKDYVSLMTMLYNAVTKIALALRPGQADGPAYQAALQPIADLGSATVALSACTTFFSAATHGSALCTRARQLATDVLRAVQQLAAGLEDEDGATLYVRTGAVHEAIDRARAQLPASELDAVRATFIANQACLDDGLPEVQGLIDGDGDDAEQDSDGWGELAEEFGEDFAPSKLTPAERKRVGDVSQCDSSASSSD